MAKRNQLTRLLRCHDARDDGRRKNGALCGTHSVISKCPRHHHSAHLRARQLSDGAAVTLVAFRANQCMQHIAWKDDFAASASRAGGDSLIAHVYHGG